MLQNFAPGWGPFFKYYKKVRPPTGANSEIVKGFRSILSPKPGANPGANPRKPGANPEFHEASLKQRGQIHVTLGKGAAVRTHSLPHPPTYSPSHQPKCRQEELSPRANRTLGSGERSGIGKLDTTTQQKDVLNFVRDWSKCQTRNFFQYIF